MLRSEGYGALRRLGSRKSVPALVPGASGSALIECALLLPLFLLLLAGGVDLGRAWYFAAEVSFAAESGALYGVRNPEDTSGMQSAAGVSVPDVPGLQALANYGSECSDGSAAIQGGGPNPSCAINAVAFVEVDTQAVYHPLLYLPGLPQVVLTAKSRLRTAP